MAATGPAWDWEMRWGREKRWLGRLLVLLLLGLVIAVSSIALTLCSQQQASVVERSVGSVPIANTKAEAEASAAKALADLLVKNGMSPEEAGRVAQKAATELLGDLSRDTSGEMARKFGEWIRASRAPQSATDVREKSAAVLPYIKSALERGLKALTVPANAAVIVASLTGDALTEIGKGFFVGLGGLPWDLLKEWITGPSGNDRPIVVNCTSCPEKQPPDKQPPVQATPCPKCPEGVTPCPKCREAVTRVFEIRFASGQSSVAKDNPEVARAAEEALRFKDATVLLWAHTDTRASETYNQDLSWKRADAVRSALTKKNVSDERIRVAPMGEREPPVRTEDNVDKAANRVVRIEVRSASGP